MGFQEYLQEINSKIGLKEIKSPRNGVEVNVKYYAWRDVRVNARSESSISQDKVKQSVLQSLTEHGVSLKISSGKLVLFVESHMFFKLYQGNIQQIPKLVLSKLCFPIKHINLMVGLLSNTELGRNRYLEEYIKYFIFFNFYYCKSKWRLNLGCRVLASILLITFCGYSGLQRFEVYSAN